MKLNFTLLLLFVMMSLHGNSKNLLLEKERLDPESKRNYSNMIQKLPDLTEISFYKTTSLSDNLQVKGYLISQKKGREEKVYAEFIISN